MMKLLLALWLLPQVVLAAPAALMISPAHDERVDVSSHTLKFRWRGEAEKAYVLDVYYRKSRKPSRSFKVKGASYEVRFKKLPPVFYWRVRPAENIEASNPRVNRVHLYQNSALFVNAFLGLSSSNIILRSREFSRSADVSGNLLEIHADYRIRALKNRYSVAFHARQSSLQSGGDELKELRFGAELGYHLRSGQRDHHSIYLGYYLLNDLDFRFDDVSAKYSVNFLTLRHFFRKPVGNKFEAELGTGLQFPVPSSFRPSVSLKPLIGYRLGQHWRLDAFAFFENYISTPEEKSAGQDVEIRQRNLGGGLGFTYRN